MTMAIPKLYSIREAAEALRISKSQLYNLVLRGRILAYKPGGAIRIPEYELENYLKSTRPKRAARRAAGR